MYAVFALNPVTVIDPLPDWLTEAVIEPGVETAVYEVMAEPPLLPGAVNETVTLVLEARVAVPIVGAPGNSAPCSKNSPPSLNVPVR